VHELRSEPRLGLGGPPLGKGGRGSLPVDFPADEVALRIKVILDLAVDSDEFLKRLLRPEFEHRRFSSSKRLMGILGPIVLPTSGFSAFEVAGLPRAALQERNPSVTITS
jgi:hypothetical protein